MLPCRIYLPAITGTCAKLMVQDIREGFSVVGGEPGMQYSGNVVCIPDFSRFCWQFVCSRCQFWMGLADLPSDQSRIMGSKRRGLSYNAPGGWEYYRLSLERRGFHGMGNAVPHSEVFAGIQTFCSWLLLGMLIILYAALRVFSTMFHPCSGCILLPLELSKAVEQYVDTCATFFLLAGLFFLIRFCRIRKLYGSLVRCMCVLDWQLP